MNFKKKLFKRILFWLILLFLVALGVAGLVKIIKSVTGIDILLFLLAFLVIIVLVVILFFRFATKTAGSKKKNQTAATTTATTPTPVKKTSLAWLWWIVVIAIVVFGGRWSYQYYKSSLVTKPSGQTTTTQAVVTVTTPYDKPIYEAAEGYGVNANLIKAVIQQESGFDEKKLGQMGEIGLMQLMPETIAWCGIADPSVSSQNIDCGVHYLSDLLKKYGGDVELALAAYNCGEDRVDKLRPTGTETFDQISGQLPDKTQKHVPAVMRFYREGIPTAMASQGELCWEKIPGANGTTNIQSLCLPASINKDDRNLVLTYSSTNGQGTMNASSEDGITYAGTWKDSGGWGNLHIRFTSSTSAVGWVDEKGSKPINLWLAVK